MRSHACRAFGRPTSGRTVFRLNGVRRSGPIFVLWLALLAGCGGSGAHSEQTLEIAVNASFSKTPYVAETIANGASLAVLELEQNRPLVIGDTTYKLEVRRFDTGGSPITAVSNIRRAVAEHAIAILDEGTGVGASWEVANAAHIPIAILYQGGIDLVDPAKRPNAFRIVPTDHGVAYRLAEYLVPKGLKVALLHDDSGYGQEGAAVLARAFAQNPEALAARLTLPPAARRAPLGGNRRARLGTGPRDRQGIDRGQELGLARPVLHAPRRCRPTRPAGTGRSPRVGGRSHLRLRTVDRRRRPGPLLQLRVEVSGGVRGRERWREDEGGQARDPAARVRHVLLRLRPPARFRASGCGRSRRPREGARRAQPGHDPRRQRRRARVQRQEP